MYSIYTNKMSVIGNGVLKHNGTKPKFKGKKIGKETLQKNKKTPLKIPGSKSTNDIQIVDDVESEVSNLPKLANEKHYSSGLKSAVQTDGTANVHIVDETDTSDRKSSKGRNGIIVDSNKIAKDEHNGLKFKQVLNNAISDPIKGTNNNKSEIFLDSSSLDAVHRDSVVNHYPVYIPTATSQLSDSVSVSDVLPGKVEENHKEVLTKVGNHKRKDSLILPDPVQGTSHPFEEQNGSLNDSLSIQREVSKLSMISNKSTESKLPSSVVHLHKNDLEEKDQTTFGANESLIQSAIPNLLPGQAMVCLILNILIPGTGTILSGFFILCGGKTRMSSKHENVTFMTIFVNLCVGLSQLMTVALLLVGWFWSIAWGVSMVIQAAEWQKRRKLHRAKQLQSFTLSAFSSSLNGRTS